MNECWPLVVAVERREVDEFKKYVGGKVHRSWHLRSQGRTPKFNRISWREPGLGETVKSRIARDLYFLFIICDGCLEILTFFFS